MFIQKYTYYIIVFNNIHIYLYMYVMCMITKSYTWKSHKR